MLAIRVNLNVETTSRCFRFRREKVRYLIIILTHYWLLESSVGRTPFWLENSAPGWTLFDLREGGDEGWY